MLAHINQGHDDSISQSAILATKLYPPAISTNLEPRSELVARLERNRHRAMTLISAPTGYGKSTLAGEWLGVSETPGCWVSLDEEDDDPHIFLAYVVAAIRSVFPDVLLHTQTLLEAPALSPSAAVARTLLNDLERLPRRILLVLDDLHTIRSLVVYDLLARLLRHPSSKLHLVLICRSDPPLPLPTLRAHNQVTEIRTRHLSFSEVETASLLKKMLNREIDDATAAAWTQRTEGWVTAISLAAIALRERDQNSLQPDDQSIDSHHLQEYLLTEIINNLDLFLREWLLTIAWLDRFCPALCTAVRQADAASVEIGLSGEAFIQRLRDDNLFVIPLDRDRRWFRLHHLFRDQLRTWARNHYQVDEIAAFHQRAGAWFARQNLPDEAIRHLVLGGDCAAAEKVVHQHRYDLMNSEHWHRLERWLSHFPEEVVASSAMLTSTVALTAMHVGQYPKMVRAFRQVEQLLPRQAPESAEYDAVRGDFVTITAIHAIAAGDPATIHASAQRALHLLPEDALLVRSLAYGAAAAGLQMNGRFADGCRLLEATLGEPQWTPRIRTQLMVYLCIISFLQGDLTMTQAWAETAARFAARRRLIEPLCTARHYLGVVHFLRDECDVAEPFLSAVVKDYAASAQQSHMIMSAFALALIYVLRDDFKQADVVIDRLAIHFQDSDSAWVAAWIEPFRVELALRCGNLTAARHMRVGIDFDVRPPLWFFYLPQLTPIKLLLAEGTPDALSDARATLEEFEERMRRINRNLARLDGLALLALVCETQGDTDCAAANLTKALLLARGGGLVRPFVDLGPSMADLLRRLRERDDTMTEATRAFVVQVLAAFPNSASLPTQGASSSSHEFQTASVVKPPLESLTARELEILQQLTTDRTPAEIAAENVVSVATVRSQIKSIYRKLDVHSRIEAVNRCRELNIL